MEHNQPDLEWHSYSLVMSPGSSGTAEFYVDGTLVSTIVGYSQVETEDIEDLF